MRKNDSTLFTNPRLQEAVQNRCNPLERPVVSESGRASDLGKVLDVERLLTTVGDDADFLRELCELFVSTYPELMTELGAAIRDGQPSRIRTAAHQLKGMVANFAAGTAIAISQEIENCAKDGKLQEIPRAFCELEKELSRVKVALEALIQFVAD